MVGGYVPTKLRVTAEQECLGPAAVRAVYRIQGVRNHATHEFDVDRVYADDPAKYFFYSETDAFPFVFSDDEYNARTRSIDCRFITDSWRIARESMCDPMDMPYDRRIVRDSTIGRTSHVMSGSWLGTNAVGTTSIADEQRMAA